MLEGHRPVKIVFISRRAVAKSKVSYECLGAECASNLLLAA